MQRAAAGIGLRTIQRAAALTPSGGGAAIGLRASFSEQELKEADFEILQFMKTYNMFKERFDKGQAVADQENARKMLAKVIEWTTPRNFRYINKGFPQTVTEVGALFRHSPMYPYYVFPTSYGAPSKSNDAELADGEYCFGIRYDKRDEVLVCRDKDKAGHWSLTGGKMLYYAGKVKFAGGQLLWWNNDTGHYQTEARDKAQATAVPVDTFVSPLLPLNKFVRFK